MQPSPPRLTETQRFHWLRLIRTERVGPVTFRHLVNRFGSAEAALDALPRFSAENGAGRAIVPARDDDIRRELDAAARLGARFVALGEPEYPAALAQMETAPPLLAVLGDAGALALPMIAMVGSRNASANGMRLTQVMAGDLAAAGYAVASGLARGIDRAAHGGALEKGATVAVMAGGLDRPYPPQNLDLYDRIAAAPGACAVSVMPFGHEPQARDFPRRNGIIAGLSLAVVVVEAAERSGSLITASMATEIGRLVFAVPGHPADSRSRGTNTLIRDGADLVRDAADILELVAPLRGVPRSLPLPDAAPAAAPAPSRLPLAAANPAAMPAATADDRAAAAGGAPRDPLSLVVSCLGPAPTATDELIRQSGLPASVVHATLLELELDGRLERGSGGLVSLLG